MNVLIPTLFLSLFLALPAAAQQFPVLFVETLDGELIRIDGAKSFTVRDPRANALNIVPLDDGEEMVYEVPGVGIWAFELGELNSEEVHKRFNPMMLLLLPQR